MKKRLLSFILLLFAGITAVYAFDFSAVAPTGQTLYYTITSGGSSPKVQVTYPGSYWRGYTKPSGSLTIPSTVTTYGGTTFSVTSIGEYAFEGCSSLTSMTIPNSVTSIENSAFGGCSSLTSVTIPNSVTSIGDVAFSGCYSLASVTIPNSVTSIGYSAFSVCISLTSVTIPNSVTSIGEGAFSGCISLTSVTIPNSVTEIGDDAFYGCSSLTSVNIPNSVTSIGNEAFYECSSLTSVTIPNSVTSIGNSAFELVRMLYYYGNATGAPWGALCMNGYIEDSLYYTSSVKDTLTGAHPAIVSASIPNSVTSIRDSAFYDCSSLTSVNIPNSVTSIENSAFGGCSSLTSVTIPNSVTSIENSAFRGCSSLTSVTIPNSVTLIQEGVFAFCSSLTSVTIPNSVTSIGDWAFAYCSSLTSVTIPNSVTSIENSAFGDCSSLTSVTIPNSVISIGVTAFDYCSGLTSITVSSGNTVYDSRSNCNAIIHTATNTLVTGCQNTTIPNSVTSIGSFAFRGCRGLTSLTIPNSVTSIGDWAFEDCCNLTSVTAKPTVACSMRSNVFTDVPSNIPVYIPCGSRSSYSSASGWNHFTNFVEVMFDSVHVASADESMGTAAVVTQPTCESSTATIVATSNAGYTFVNWTEDSAVVSTDATYTFSVTADRTLTAHFAPESTCGIAPTDLPYTDNFDSYTTSTTAKTGVEPDCWTLANQYVDMTDEYKPMLYYSSANAHSGSYSLILNKRGIYAMPEYDGDVSTLQLSMYVKQGMAKYQLQVGVMSDLTDASTFVTVATINNSSTAPVLNTVSFANYTGSGHYIAFRNILASGYSGDYSCNYIDDLVLDIRPANTCGISTADLPYTDNFDSFTTSTTAKTGVEPDCWTLAH